MEAVLAKVEEQFFSEEYTNEFEKFVDEHCQKFAGDSEEHKLEFVCVALFFLDSLCSI